jgi:glycosyltransferase involved in cell wall biosynthesis
MKGRRGMPQQCVHPGRHRPPRIAIVRGGEWDCTQAIPRTLDVLESMGLQATVLCWDLTAAKPPAEKVKAHQILRFRRRVPPRSIRLFLNWPAWWCWIVRQLARGRFDVVIAMNFDTLPAVAAAKALLGFRLIYDVRDPFGLVLANIRPPVPQAFGALERTLAQAADGMVLSQGDIEVCADYFGRRLARTLPTTQVLNVPTADPPRTFRPPTGRPLRINVSGYISPVRGAFILADAFGGRGDVTCDIVGEMRYPQVEQRFGKMGNATVFGRVDYDKALELMDRSDLIWLHYDNSLKNVAIASANKMFEAMMLGKPYVTADGSWMEQIARTFGLGWSLPYGDVQALQRLVERLNADPSLLVEAGRRGRECFERYFRWSRQRDNMTQLFRHVFGGGPPVPRRPNGRWLRFIGGAIGHT